VTVGSLRSGPNRSKPLRRGTSAAGRHLESRRRRRYLGLVPKNLLTGKWPTLDRGELRVLLNEVIGGPGQTHRAVSKKHFYLPLAGERCRVALVLDKAGAITEVEPGPAFDAREWEQISEEIENAVLKGPMKAGREYSFSSHRVLGSWRGARSGVQILPPPADAPRAPVEMAQHPFILEFPVMETRRWPLTNYRRIRDHRHLTLLLNVLLRGRISLMSDRSAHFWAIIPVEGAPGEHKTQWVQRYFFGPLEPCVRDELSPPAEKSIRVIEAAQYRSGIFGVDGEGLRLPSDLDDSICAYQALSPANRAKFNRAAFWLDIASAVWETSASASFAALVSAVETFTEQGERHSFICPECGEQGTHELVGATKRFKAVLGAHAETIPLGKMYGLRSEILHGAELMRLDKEINFGWDPPEHDQWEMIDGLWRAVKDAMREWLRNPQIEPVAKDRAKPNPWRKAPRRRPFGPGGRDVVWKTQSNMNSRDGTE
jgi:hypothetical protein